MVKKMIQTQLNSKLNTNNRVAIYCRLSKDDELQGESASIANQRAILLNFCEQNGWSNVTEFQDDGYSGLNMNRPDFQKLLTSIQRKEINVVVTKDMSRLSRNHVDTGFLTDEFFPRNGVRYIALNDSVDTIADNDIVPFKGILNEMYSKDISKKVHSSYYLKATQGKFTGCVAPIGYKKDPEDKNHLIIDEETEHIVKYIFKLASEGHGPNYIRTKLEEKKMPCPTWWNRERGIRNKFTKWELQDPENGKYIWDFTVIQDILANPVYMGAIASQKRNYRFKVGVINEKKPDEWIVVEDTHEAIVDKATFTIVQNKVKSRKKDISEQQPSLFAGLMKCAECGKALTFRYSVAHCPTPIYACVTYTKYGKNHCTQHRVEMETLKKIVLKKIRSLARKAIADDKAMAERVKNSCSKELSRNVEVLTKKVAADQERINLLDKMIAKLYEDMLSQKVSEENFNSLLDKIQTEQASLKDAVKQNEAKLSDTKKMNEEAEAWIANIKEYSDIKELDSATLNRLINKILVHEDIDKDGNRTITAEIHFNFKEVPEVETFKKK